MEKISSVSEFISLTTTLEKSSENVSNSGVCFNSGSKKVCLYRGVGKTKNALKDIIEDGKDLHESRYEMYKDVKRVFPKEFLKDTKAFDKIIKARHYGIPARLIDITHNPLVALFFAAGGFRTTEGKEKEEDGKIFIFGCGVDSKPCLSSDVEQGIGYDGFMQVLDVFRIFLTSCKQVENLPVSDFKNSLIELIGYIRKTFNSTSVDFLSICASIFCIESLIDSLWKAFLDEDSVNGLKEEERRFYDSLTKVYSECVSGYIQQTANGLKSDGNTLEFKSLASFLGDFCGLYFVKPKVVNEQIERQQGAFLLHSSASHAFDLDGFNLRKISGFTVQSVIVDSASKANILKELKERDVTFSRLFPGVVNYRKDIYSLKK